MEVQECLFVIVTCFSLMTNNDQHFYVHICIFFIRVSIYFALFYLDFCFLLLRFQRSWRTLNTNPLQVCAGKHLLPVCALSFHSLNNVTPRAQNWILMKVNFLIFFLFYESCFWCLIYEIFTEPKLTKIVGSEFILEWLNTKILKCEV